MKKLLLWIALVAATLAASQPASADPAKTVTLTAPELEAIVAAEIARDRYQTAMQAAGTAVTKVRGAFSPPPAAPVPPSPSKTE